MRARRLPSGATPCNPLDVFEAAVRLWSKAKADPKRGASRVLTFAPLVVAVSLLAATAIDRILDKAGRPAVPLDDAFIHFQYAKRLATGHFFSYSPGDGYSSGATSLLWPVLLAIPWGLGARGLAIIWAAWALGWIAFGALAYETYQLARGLAGRPAAYGAAAMVLCFGGYVWFASSGMETTALAWVLARTARRASEWGELAAGERVASRRRELVALAFVAPLVRPEGALASAILAAALALFPEAAPANTPESGARRRIGGGERLWGALALAGVMGPPLVNWALTGRTASSTAAVKWLPLNPYYGRAPSLWATVRDNADTFVRVLLDGRQWSAVFVPSGARVFALLGLAAIPLASARARRTWRGGIVALVAFGMLLPCTYLSFLWNRLRYLWPFVFAWFIGLACLAAEIRQTALRLGYRARGLDALVAGIFAGALATHLPWTLDDLATSASAIDRQQVTLGEWAARTLPADARIGVNDTGAIAYVGEHRTFDIVGLTTPSEAPYWVAGAGSRFEHYEKLHERSPSLLPTHFIVYPHWMACDAVLGRELERATVTDQTILGGVTMVAYEARWNLLGSGARPLFAELAAGARLVDEIDVADLESEKEHDYELGPNTEADDVPIVYEQDGRAVAADGARVRRSYDRFVLRARGAPGGPRSPLVLVARLSSAEGATIEVRARGRLVGSIDLEPTAWDERAIPLAGTAEANRAADDGVRTPDDAGPAGGSIPIELVARGGGTFGAAHYWLYGPVLPSAGGGAR